MLAVALLGARQWRVVAGAAVAAAGQLAVAWAAAGSWVMAQYVGTLWRLTLNPDLIEVYPSEVHSIRGFLQLLIPSPPIVSVCAGVGSLVALVVAVRCWRPAHRGDLGRTLSVRWGLLALLTLVASPHLVSYDLLLLTVPLLLLADWTALYFAPFSGMIVARLTGIQLSVIVMVALAWRLAALCRRPIAVDLTEACDRRAEAGGGIVPEFQHARVAVEY